MRRLRPAVLIAVAAVAAVPAADAAAQSTVSTPSARTLYENGPSGRYLMDGQWLFRRDKTGLGLRAHWMRASSTAGWTPVTVPNAWNATDPSPQSFAGGVGWYRKDFRLPSRARGLSWIVRFESVNYRTRAWINGRPIGSNSGAYLPFELQLPASALKRSGTNRLVVRVDSRRRPSDFPPAGLSARGTPTGGWWNYGGILREVYLRKVDDVDLATVSVHPRLPCATCAATVDYRVTVRNYAGRARTVRLSGRFGTRAIGFGSVTVGPRGSTTFVRSVRVASPRLWSPSSPHLYSAPLTLTSGGRTLQRYTLKTGIRSIKVVHGQLYLNGKPLHMRGVSLHEDSKDKGFAVDNAWRDKTLAWIKDVGATVVRSHYPLHPYFQEQADRLGIMQWSEIPVYSVRTTELKRLPVRRLATRELQNNILTNGNHPSVIVWSIGNELSSKPGIVQGDYIRRAAAVARRLDGTRPVGLAVAGYPSAGCQPEYAPLDVVGINEYFGWYPGPNGQIADRSALPDYLDQVRACYRNKAVIVTEFGAEANREGPPEEKGTFAYQQEFIDFHLGVYASKPWLSGAIYWTLQEFRVRPDWEGGNPRPTPPIHQKAVIDFDGNKKPGFFDLQRIYRATSQLG